MTAVSRGRIFAVLASCALVCVSACGPPAGPVVTLTSLRFVKEDPQEIFVPQSLYQEPTVFDWTFDHGAVKKIWRVSGFDKLDFGAGGMTLYSKNPYIQLVRRTDFEASEVSAIDVRIQGLVGGRLALLWAAADEPFRAERRVIVQTSTPAYDLPQTYRFLLAGHPAWRGRIGKLRLGISSPPNRPLAVLEVRGVSQVLDPERLAAALGRSWQIELGDDMRSGFLALPGHPQSRDLKVPADARFHVAWGLPKGLDTRVHFQVLLTEPGKPDQVLFRADPPPAESGWHDVDVDLAEHAGETARLSLVTQADGPLDPLRGLPAWGNPEVLTHTFGKLPVDIVLVSIDTLRADRLSLYGYGRPTSPHLDAWARGSATVFEHVVAAAPWTLPSHTSMLTGLGALRHGVNHGMPAPPRLETLAEILRRAGYSTQAVTGGGFLRPEYGLGQGFDRYRFWADRYDPSKELSEDVGRAIRWIEGVRERPFFLFFHTYEVHSPYLPRQPYLRELTGREEGGIQDVRIPPTAKGGFQVRHRFQLGGEAEPPASATDEAALASWASDLYDGSIAYADQQLERLLGFLESSGLSRRTLVVITSDHGEMLGEHGLAGHGCLYDENLMVPLLIAAPNGRGAGHRVRDQVRSVDILPTILDLAGLPPKSNVDGVSLAPFLAGKRPDLPTEAWSYAASTNYGASLRMGDRLKYIYNDTAWTPLAGTEKLFRLDRDPREQHNLASGEMSTAPFRRELRKRFEAELPGLWLRFQNRGATPLRVLLEGASITEYRLKSLELPRPGISWTHRGQASFFLPPGASTSLVVDGPLLTATDLSVAQGGDGSPLSVHVDPDAAAATERFYLVDGKWRQGPEGTGSEPAGASASVVIVQRDPGDAAAPLTDQVKQRLREDLSALGYVQ